MKNPPYIVIEVLAVKTLIPRKGDNRKCVAATNLGRLENIALLELFQSIELSIEFGFDEVNLEWESLVLVHTGRENSPFRQKFALYLADGARRQQLYVFKIVDIDSQLCDLCHSIVICIAGKGVE